MAILQSLKVKNYRSCKDTLIELDNNTTVLVGANGSGKTNILTALMLLGSLTKPDRFRRNRHQEFSSEIEIEARYIVNNKRLIHKCKLLVDNVGGNNDIVTGAEQSWYVYDFTKSKKRAKIPLEFFDGTLSRRQNNLLLAGVETNQMLIRHMIDGRIYPTTQNFDVKNNLNTEAIQAIEEIYSLLDDVTYYSATQFTNPSNCPVSFEIETDGRNARALRLSDHKRFLYDLYQAKETEAFVEFKNIIGREHLNLVDDITFNTVETASIDVQVRTGGVINQQKRVKNLVVPQFQIGDNKLSPNQLSDGTFKTISLLFYVITKASSMLLIEEPEVCVHHGLLNSIIDVVQTYSEGKQIIISTHSDHILDKIDPEQVILVQNTDFEGTIAGSLKASLSKNSLGALKDYLEHEGNLGEYWRHGGFDE